MAKTEIVRFFWYVKAHAYANKQQDVIIIRVVIIRFCLLLALFSFFFVVVNDGLNLSLRFLLWSHD